MMTKLHFRVEQIALAPIRCKVAQEILSDLGLNEWIVDKVAATGTVMGEPCSNEATLRFNYQAGNGSDEAAGKPLELEILEYTRGNNWIDENFISNSVSHLGMHVTEEQLDEFRMYFFSKNIGIAQEVDTTSHTNEAIKDSRRYKYVIFDTRDLIGVDLKFIVRKDITL
jgi:hypothetical protein